MEAKEEIKKAFIVKPIELIIVAALTTLGTWFLAQIPYVRETLLPSIPPWALAIGNLVFAVLAIIFFVFWRRTLKELRREQGLVVLPPVGIQNIPALEKVDMFDPDEFDEEILKFLYDFPNGVYSEELINAMQLSPGEAAHRLKTLERKNYIKAIPWGAFRAAGLFAYKLSHKGSARVFEKMKQ